LKIIDKNFVNVEYFKKPKLTSGNFLIYKSDTNFELQILNKPRLFTKKRGLFILVVLKFDLTLIIFQRKFSVAIRVFQRV